jgi:hypothetical protein
MPISRSQTVTRLNCLPNTGWISILRFYHNKIHSETSDLGF